MAQCARHPLRHHRGARRASLDDTRLAEVLATGAELLAAGATAVDWPPEPTTTKAELRLRVACFKRFCVGSANVAAEAATELLTEMLNVRWLYPDRSNAVRRLSISVRGPD